MDRRLNERVTVQFEAKVTRLNKLNESANGLVGDISTSGLSVIIPMQLASDEPVELEIADSVLSGRVVYSNPENSLFRTGIAVNQIRLGTTGLSHLLQMTISEAMSEVPGLDYSHIG